MRVWLLRGFLLAGLVFWIPIFVVVGYGEKNARIQLIEQGVSAEAVIIKKTTRKSWPKPRARYSLLLEFSAENGPHRKTFFVSRKRWEKKQVGESEVVTFLPHDPESARLGRVRPESTERVLLEYLFGGILLTLVWGVTTLITEIPRRRRLRLLREGEEVAGEVVSVKRGHRWLGGKTRVNYVFPWPPKETRSGKSMFPVPATEAPEVGSRLPILVDRSKPSRYGWVRDLEHAAGATIPRNQVVGGAPSSKTPH